MLGISPFDQASDVFASSEYGAFMRDAWPRYRQLKRAADMVGITTEYQRRLPLYAVARCPFCDRAIPERVDTYSLNGFGWHRPGVGLGWGSTLGDRIPLAGRCPHTRIVDFFLDLRGRTPDDLFPDKEIRAGPGSPCIMRVPMRVSDARAVVHELPIGRFDQEEPEHAYSVYFMTYFTESDDSFQAATHDWNVHYGLVEYSDVDFDIGTWAGDGRLLWLDREDPTLPLVRDNTRTFPYRDLSGDRTTERMITRAGASTPKRPFIERILPRRGRRSQP